MKYLNNNHLQRLHIFGCPVYVLELQLQDATKRKQQSHKEIYLGLGKNHLSNVHLVLNPHTVYIPSWYHLAFNKSFSIFYSGGEFDADI